MSRSPGSTATPPSATSRLSPERRRSRGTRRRERAIRQLSVTFLLLALTACGERDSERTVDRADLEGQVAELYPPRDPETVVSVDCAGDLRAAVEATQSCTVGVDGSMATVRVSVTEVVAERVEVSAVPVVSAHQIAATLLESLGEEGYAVSAVECPGELLGVVEAVLTCRARPEGRVGEVHVEVRSVDGLVVDFRYEVIT